MVTYTQTRDGVGIMVDGAFVPADVENRDWNAYQAFLGGGGTPEDAENLTVQEERAAAKERIDAQADRELRAQADAVISSPVFVAKLAEAKEVLGLVAASQLVVAANYPLLAADLAVAPTTQLEDVAQGVVDQETVAKAEWAKIEAARLQAHQDVDNAGTIVAIEAVQPAVNWTADVPGGQPAPGPLPV